MSKYDIIIIGSGLGGLECAAILSKEGYNVCVLEKNPLFGGCFQTYQRRGHRLDTGIHYIGSLDEGQIMNQYFRYFGIMDKLAIKRLDEEAFDRIYFKERYYDFAMNYDTFVETLCKEFPQERDHLKRYTEEIRKVGQLISIEHLQKGLISQNGMDYFNTSASGFIQEITPNSNLQQILAGSSLLYGGIKDKSTFYEHAMITNSYMEGAYRFIDGSMQVSDELIKLIRANGGTVLNNKEVTRIVVQDEKVTAVEVNQEERFESDYIISNIHPQVTLKLLDKNRSIRPAYASRINGLENSYGVFTTYLTMKKESCPYLNHNIYLHQYEDVWYDKSRQIGPIPSCMISMQASSTHPQYTDVVSILTPMYIDEVAEWAHSTPEKRGDSYRLFKEKKAEEILRFIRQCGINFDSSIEQIYTTTPLSYRDYTGTVDGSAYGILKDYQYPQAGFVSTRTKLKNLFLTGQNMNVHGALGVTLTAMLTCSEFVGQAYLAKKIGYA